MSAYVRWDPKISVGVEEIDLEHRTFVLLINQLDEYQAQPEMVRRILLALMKYAAFHFQSEENTMYSAAYPDAEAHWQLHLAVLEQLNITLQKFSAGEIDCPQILDFLRNWYCTHTSKVDMQLGDFLKKQREKQDLPRTL